MYPGGKGVVFRQLINQIPPHKRYFELFLGDAAVLRNKRPAALNLGLDIDGRAVETVRCSIVKNGDDTMRLGAIVNNGGIVENGEAAAAWEFHTGSAVDFLNGFDFAPGDFVYLDPPYLMHTRRQQRPLYAFEFSTEEDHEELLTAVKSRANVMFMLSGYWSELYAAQLRGWRTISFPVMTRGGTWAEEWVWMNYPEPVRLHDYTFLGDDFRERERIGRKARRWVNGLQRLPILEQRAILSQMKEAGLVD